MFNNEEFQLFVSDGGITIKDPVSRKETFFDRETQAYEEIVEAILEAGMAE